MFERKLLAEGGIIDFKSDFLSEEEADKYFAALQEQTSWDQHEYKNYRTGSMIKVPRLTAWYADSEDMNYSYSGITETVKTWTPLLLVLKDKIEEATAVKYNSVLLNCYRNGKDSVGFHADDEKELGINANIASLSLGDARTFQLDQYKGRPPLGKETFSLTHGSLLVMSGATQHYWKHSIPKTYKDVGPRINLTFRWYNK